MRLTYTPTAPDLEASTPERALSGLALPYGKPGNTSAGRVIVNAGAVRLPADLRRVKLFTEHGRTVPVGYAVSADDTAERLDMAFHVAATPSGDTALLEASEGIRDALSVELDNVTIRAGHVTGADLVAVALTAIPAFADARLNAADTPEEETTMPNVTGEFTGTIDGQLADAPDDGAADTPAEASAVRASAPRAMTAARAPQRSLSAIAKTAGDAIQRGDARALNAALVDITWSEGAGADGAPPQLVELWQGLSYTRKFVPASNYGTDLSSMTLGGFRWKTYPGVDEYAGDKTAVPSFGAQMEFVPYPAKRLAGANDIDRAYLDLSVPGFWEAYWQAMTDSYAVQSDEYVLETLQAAAPAPGTATSVWGAIVNGLINAAVYGGTPKVAIGADLVESVASTTSADVPYLLTQMFGSLQSLIDVSAMSGMDGEVMVWSQQAITVKEAGATPIRVQAVNIPNGGIDVGVFGYIGAFVSQPAAVKRYTIGAAAGGGEDEGGA